jgi:hypothetical protein
MGSRKSLQIPAFASLSSRHSDAKGIQDIYADGDNVPGQAGSGGLDNHVVAIASAARLWESARIRIKLSRWMRQSCLTKLA